MNVQEFVKNAITEIAAGVAEARDGLAEYGASAGSDKVYGYTKVRIPAHHEHPFRTNVNTSSGST